MTNFRKFSRTVRCQHLANKLASLRAGETDMVTVDLLNDCMCLGESYDQPDAYVHIDDFIVISKMPHPRSNHYIIVDCTNTQRYFTVYDFMTKRVTLEGLAGAYGPRNVFRGYVLHERKDGEPVLAIDCGNPWEPCE